MDFLGDIVRSGMLSVPEILRRRQAGEISHAFAERALSGRVAQELADLLPDGQAARYLLLDHVSDVEDWFHHRFQPTHSEVAAIE
jgi:hypothetical protein